MPPPPVAVPNWPMPSRSRPMLAVMVPKLVMPPMNVEIAVSQMPAEVALIRPMFVMPPPAVALPNWLTLTA